MRNDEFVSKFQEILDKVDEMCKLDFDRIIVSNDPDCDPDYGVDELGRIIIDGDKTNLPVERLEQIKYRAKGGVNDWDYNEFYISLLFDNGLVVYLFIGGELPMPGAEWIEIDYSRRFFQNPVSKELLHCVDFNWGDKFAVRNGKIVAYLGDDEEVHIDEGIKEIGYRAFQDARVKKVYLSDTIEKIDEFAFCASKIQEIELNSVKHIGENAFRGCDELKSIDLPETLQSIGEEAFCNSGICTLEQIENKSNIELGIWLF